MRFVLVVLGLLVLPLFAANVVAVQPQCIGVPRGDPWSDDYECVGVYLGDGTCVGVYHNHPNPGHPDGCTGLDSIQSAGPAPYVPQEMGQVTLP